jgi:DNA-directed RNA polymerase I, II, and III subunit RPABC2
MLAKSWTQTRGRRAYFFLTYFLIVAEEKRMESHILTDVKQNKHMPQQRKKTTQLMTKFERARIIGIRAMQINMGSLPLIDLPNRETDSIVIATMELKLQKIPYIIRRYYADGTYEDWSVEELNVQYRD